MERITKSPFVLKRTKFERFRLYYSEAQLLVFASEWVRIVSVFISDLNFFHGK